MKIHGWGRYPSIDATISEPFDARSAQRLLSGPAGNGLAIARGAGRSYGDSALAQHIISSRLLDNFVSFNEKSGTLSCGAGIVLDQILRLSVPKGWFLPVLPGTRFVTVGGAIASDIHGKNHHLDGCFSRFVTSIKLMLASGEIVNCSQTQRKNLFRASCGGMGLTGIILQATLQLRKIGSTFIKQQTLMAHNLSDVFSLFEGNANSGYSVAWLDSMAKGKNLGRSLLYLGEHADDEDREIRESLTLSAPAFSPGFLLNKFSVRAFNSAYYAIGKHGKSITRPHYESYFFPLDRINSWNRLYGRRGFLQYQCVIPMASARDGISSLLEKTSGMGKGSFLTVLKKLGPENENLLSFPLEGYTLTLDFKFEDSLLGLLDKLDEIVLDHGGRLYLAKDARMDVKTFRQGYPNWEKFMKVRTQVDPGNLFASLQSKRLGLSHE